MRRPALTSSRHASGSDPIPATGIRAVLIVAALTLATFVTALDNTIVNVALPTIERDLELSRAGLEWVVSAYVLAFAGLMFLGGRLSDRLGRHAVFIAGAALFASASALAALAGGGGALVAARALQGAAAALLAPAALSIVGADLTPAARRTGTGVAMAAAASALALGPVFGGLIVEGWHWHGIFLVNLPVVALSVLLLRAGTSRPRTDDRAASSEAPDPAAGAMQEPTTSDRGEPLGLPGILTSGVTLAALVSVLIEAGPRGWSSPEVVGAAAVGIVAFAAFLALARRGRATVVDHDILRSRPFAASAIASLLWGLGLSGVFFFTSLYLQQVLGQAPVSAGLVFVPLALALVAAVAVVAPLCARFGSRSVVTLGLAIVAGGLAWVSTAGAGAEPSDLVLPLVLVGLGSGLTVPLTAIALEAVDAARLGMASSLLAAIREGSGALGVALIGAVVAARETALRGTGGPERLAFVGGFGLGLQVAAALMLAAAVLTYVLLRGLGEPAEDSTRAEDDGPAQDDEPVEDEAMVRSHRPAGKTSRAAAAASGGDRREVRA